MFVYRQIFQIVLKKYVIFVLDYQFKNVLVIKHFNDNKFQCTLYILPKKILQTFNIFTLFV